MKLTKDDMNKIRTFCDSLDSTPEPNEVIEHLENDESDFTVGSVRFINDHNIDDILADELSADEYMLGCFNASAISDATGWPIALIQAAQKGDQYQAIGEAMTGEHITELASIYASHDGYGSHFNPYDSSSVELKIGDDIFYVFDLQE